MSMPSPFQAAATRLWLIVLSVAVPLIAIGWWMLPIQDSRAQKVVPRKNIDLLSAQELAAFEHAIQIVKDRSAANPYDKSGYLWQAWVHNCPLIWVPESGQAAAGAHSENCDSLVQPAPPAYVRGHPGMCEHGKDLFFSWHRAQFYYFEQVLRATDPDGDVTDSRGVTGPSTADLAVPFWNWTREPSGIRYPKAVENPESPLYHDGRARAPLTEEERRRFRDKIANPLAISQLVYTADWTGFGGYPQESDAGGAGLFEARHHDILHDQYFGRGSSMSSPSTAALDPAFFLFHAYIDLLFHFRLQAHGHAEVTSQQHFLRATQPEDVRPPPGHQQGAGLANMGQVEIYFDPEKLGYGYEVTAADRLPRVEEVEQLLMAADGQPARFGATDKSPHARLLGDGLYDPAKGPPTAVFSLVVPISAAAETLRATFSRPVEARDISFAVDFYLHPAATQLRLDDPIVRQRYIVTALGYWGRGDDAGHAAMHRPDKPLYADLSAAVDDLAAVGHGGETWTLTAVVSGPPPTSNFGSLSLMY